MLLLLLVGFVESLVVLVVIIGLLVVHVVSCSFVGASVVVHIVILVVVLVEWLSIP